VRTGARHYFADPSIAAAVLGMNPASLLRDWQTFGLLFENLCLRDLAVYVRALPGAARGSLYYYRDDTGLEADAVIELADGRWAAVEVKTSQARVPQAVENLVRLRNKLVGDGGAGRVQEPAFLMVLTGVSEVAYRTSEGVYVVPITLLGP
jgi:predicted AAA+ superfamily ATPase